MAREIEITSSDRPTVLVYHFDKQSERAKYEARYGYYCLKPFFLYGYEYLSEMTRTPASFLITFPQLRSRCDRKSTLVTPFTSHIKGVFGPSHLIPLVTDCMELIPRVISFGLNR